MVRQFLAAAPEEGLARLALGRSDGLYAGLLAPRLEALRRAVRAGETETAARAARRMAGCGPGLTPSSDDLICGYLALLPSGGAWAGMAEAIAAAAARGTNDISAALLLRAGEGQFSEDALGLIGCLRRGGEHTLPPGRGIFAGRARARRLHPRRTGGREGRQRRRRPRPHARH